MNRVLKACLLLVLFALILAVCTLRVVDRTSVVESAHYAKMIDNLETFGRSIGKYEPLSTRVGFSKVSLTPDSSMALAGYGARKPKAHDGLLDSVFVRTIVLENAQSNFAIVTADLLIVHPLVQQTLDELLKANGWQPEQVYLTATHTHSSIGEWAPGLVGGLFAGTYDESVATIIAKRMMKSILEASEMTHHATMGYTESSNEDMVYNRLVGAKGTEDPLMKTLRFRTAQGDVLFATFSAHATCIGHDSRKLSGDFPSYFHEQITLDTTICFSQYAAGAVASMGPESSISEPFLRARHFGSQLAGRVSDSTTFTSFLAIRSFRIPLVLGPPQFKVSKHLALRPFLFSWAFGNEPAFVSVLQIGQTVLVGLPCDFSGELSVPLYLYAKEKGLDLIITSFNGGYMGYVTKDEWYDMEKYETRTMNWYGPGNGFYFSEIIKTVLSHLEETSGTTESL